LRQLKVEIADPIEPKIAQVGLRPGAVRTPNQTRLWDLQVIECGWFTRPRRRRRNVNLERRPI